jgi:non-ribosomal peptide synthetase component F
VLPVGHFSRDVSLLGDNSQPVPRGEVGEIVVRSRYVANGYWRNPELTAERFSPDLDGKGTRLIRTGDLGRINAEGLLEFHGRKDDRIKIRGNRVELVEIEQALERLQASFALRPLLSGAKTASQCWSRLSSKRAMHRGPRNVSDTP